MTEYIVQDTSLTAVANKIREKTGGSAPLEFPDDFITAIDTMLPTLPQTPTDSILFYSLSPFVLQNRSISKTWDGLLEYSTDRITWTEWNGEPVSSDIYKNYHCIYLKGTDNTYITAASGNGSEFVLTGSMIKCIGDFTTLLNTNRPYAPRVFGYMFYNCSNVDFDITLPENMSQYMCTYMFYGCTSLTKAPVLPALTLAGNCYSYMFSHCTSLTSAPVLPATILAASCYTYMFEYCSSLVSVPELSATTLASACYAYMFSYCTALVNPPELPALTLETFCYQGMFSHCTSLTSAPVLPATAAKQRCYQNMFEYTNISAPPALPLASVDTACCDNMFRYCAELEALPELPAITLKSQCYSGMFRSCIKIKLSETQADEYQTAYRIPTSGTGVDASSALSNTFQDTRGTFAGTPTINTTYYTSNTVIPAT